MSDWSPYGLERYRAAPTSRRNRWLLGLVVLLVVAWLSLNLLARDGTVSVGVGGQEGSVAITAPEDPGPTKTTVRIEPGRVASVDQGIESTVADSARRSAVTTDTPYPILGWALMLGPLLLLPPLARRILGRAQRVELNFGVYKGAMPIEMISAVPQELVGSRRAVEGPLFGRTRGDYIEDG